MTLSTHWPHCLEDAEDVVYDADPYSEPGRVVPLTIKGKLRMAGGPAGGAVLCPG
jgi:hypothetical protein